MRTRSHWLSARPELLVPATAAFAAVLAFVAPLADPDLPEHLAIGEWIVRHGTVPRVEPFAWTRAGQPYFAYSWLLQATYYLVLAALGPLGLHLLHAAIGAAAVLAAAAVARARGWGDATAALLGGINYTAMAAVANELRPEQLLFVLVPLEWAIAGTGRARTVTLPLLAAQAAVGCMAANTHLFFPLTAAPLVFRMAGARRTELPALVPLGAALLLGWLVSPYTLDWPAIFRLNFAPNVLLLRPPAIAEMEPGFEAMRDVGGALVLALGLLALPWLPAPGPTGDARVSPGSRAPAEEAPDRPAGDESARDRLLAFVAWAGGLALFAVAYRLLAVWWLLSLPMAGGRLRAAAAALRGHRRAGLVAGLTLAGAMAITLSPPFPSALREEGGVDSRSLPTSAAAAARPLAAWLDCRTDTRAGGRVFTAFNYGSYLTWRLPRYSVSIDGRTIFPDSVAREFAWSSVGRRLRHSRTWASADVALIPLWMAVNDDLAASRVWVRLATTGPPDGRHAGAALWTTRAWWERWRRPRSPSCSDRTGGR